MIGPLSPELTSASVAGSSECALADVVDEIAACVRRGEPVDLDAYLTQHPQWHEALRRLLPALEALAMKEEVSDVGGRGSGKSSEFGVRGSAGTSSERSTGTDGAFDNPNSKIENAEALTPALFQREREDAPSIENRKAKIQNRTLGDFELVREIGRGGMGVVYEARQMSLARRVAVKVLPRAGMLDHRQLQRFQNEARAAAQLNHPHIVDVICVGCADGVHYFAMRYVEGETLAEKGAEVGGQGSGNEEEIEERKSREALPPALSQRERESHASAPSPPRLVALSRPLAHAQIAEWLAQAAEALEHAHQSGVVHRDVKPSNLLIDREGKLWVTDFGLARFGDEAALTMTGDVLGTLRYMSPEQALGQRAAVDHRSDIYALGATLYELLARQPVFDGTDRGGLLRHVAFTQPKPLRKLDRRIPRDLETIALKALEKSPTDRYATAGEMAADLRRYLRGEPIRAKPPTFAQRTAKWSWRHRGVVATAAGVLMLAVVGLSVSTVMIARSRDEAVANRKLFEDRDRENRRMLSAIETRLALQAYQRGEIDRAKELLDRQLPGSGTRENSGKRGKFREKDEDFREFTWHWLHGAIDARLPKLRSFDDYPSEIYEIQTHPTAGSWPRPATARSSCATFLRATCCTRSPPTIRV